MVTRRATLLALQQTFGVGSTARGQGLAAAEFEALMADTERCGLVLTFAGLLADRKCLDDHAMLAHAWAARMVEGLSAAGVGMLSRRKIYHERCRVEGLLAVLDALVQRQTAVSASFLQLRRAIRAASSLMTITEKVVQCGQPRRSA